YFSHGSAWHRWEVHLWGWGFTAQGGYPKPLRVIHLPRGTHVPAEGPFPMDQSTFRDDYPIILAGWEYPSPPAGGQPGNLPKRLSPHLGRDFGVQLRNHQVPPEWQGPWQTNEQFVDFWVKPNKGT